MIQSAPVGYSTRLQTGVSPLMRCRYFAYGLNLDVASMAERCPGAKLAGPAELPAHRFTINRLGLATVVPAPDYRVLGVMWYLTPSDEDSLDEFEGVGVRLYLKEHVRLCVAGSMTDALIYRAVESRGGSPRPGYLDLILAAARAHGFAADYIAELDRHRVTHGRALGVDWRPT